MKQVIINIPSNKYKALMDFVKSIKIKDAEVNDLIIPEAHKKLVRERVKTQRTDKLMSEKDVDNNIRL